MHSVDAIRSVLDSALDGKRARRALEKNPSEILNRVIYLLCKDPPNHYVVMPKVNAGETIVFDQDANIGVLLYAHRSLFLDPVWPKASEIFVFNSDPSEDEIRTALENSPSWSPQEALTILERVVSLAPLVDNQVVELTCTGFGGAAKESEDLRFQDFSEIPVPIGDYRSGRLLLRGDYRWHQLRPRIVEAIGTDSGRQLDEAWYRVRRQLWCVLESDGMLDPLLRSRLEKDLFEFMITYLLRDSRVDQPNSDITYLHTLFNVVAPDLSGLTPSMMVEVREGEEFERWRRDLRAALRELLKTEAVPGLKGEGREDFGRCLQGRANEIDRKSRKSKTTEHLRDAAIGLVFGGVGIPAADAILNVPMGASLAEAASISAMAVGGATVPYIRAWLKGELRAQSALQNHYRAFIQYSQSQAIRNS